MVDRATLKNPNGLLPESEKTTQSSSGDKRTWTANNTPEEGTYTLQAIVDASDAKKKVEEESLATEQGISVEAIGSGQGQSLQETQTDTDEDLSNEEDAAEAEEDDQEENIRAAIKKRQASIQQKEASEKKEKQGLSIGWFMIALIMALLFDATGFLINFIPFIGQAIASLIVTPLGLMIIWLMHVFSGVPLNTKTKSTLALTGIIEFIPIVQMLPALTACVLISKAIPLLEKRALDVAKKIGGDQAGELVQKQISHPNSAIMNSK
jgi:cation transport ATPase